MLAVSVTSTTYRLGRFVLASFPRLTAKRAGARYERTLRQQLRAADGRNRDPSVVSLDCMVKTTQKGEVHGCDAGKSAKGRKRMFWWDVQPKDCLYRGFG